MLFILGGICILSNSVSLNASSSITDKLSGKIIDLIPLLLNASSPIIFSPFGRITSFTPSQFLNAFSPIL